MQIPSQRASSARQAGLSAPEMLVVLAIVTVAGLFLLMAVPRGRERARAAGCQRNLAQIGLALGLYDQLQGALPTVGPLKPADAETSEPGPGPLRTLLETLGVADFQGLQPGGTPPAKGPIPGEIPVPGFVCSSDPNATSGRFAAPISYRAVTGSDRRGNDGPFAPGRRVSLAEVEQGDGSSFTAGFSERLVGDGHDGQPSDVNYAVQAGAIPPEGCSPQHHDEGKARWRGDAGSSWRGAGYVSTLYNHGLRPNGRPSCLSADGSEAIIAASSGHDGGVNLLMLDASVRTIRPSIDARVWQAYATVSSPGSTAGDPEIGGRRDR